MSVFIFILFGNCVICEGVRSRCGEYTSYELGGLKGGRGDGASIEAEGLRKVILGRCNILCE